MAWRPFSKEEEHTITKAVADAEDGTSGEIRVHIDRYCKTNPLLKAQNFFHHLKMDQTELRNGVIIIESNIEVAIAKAQARNSLPKIFGTLCAKECGLIHGLTQSEADIVTVAFPNLKEMRGE